MRPVTIGEIETIVDALRPLAGARLQKVYTGDQDLVLEFYTQGREFWLWFEMSPQSPMVVLLNRKPPKFPKKQKPLGLFLRSHGVHRHLVKVERPPGLGRVLRLYLGPINEDEDLQCIIEARLFPHGQNIGAKEGGKEIWWKRPQALPPQQTQEGPSEDGRSLEKMGQDWWTGRFPRKTDVRLSNNSPRDYDKEIKKELGRKQRAIGKIEADLKKNREIVWRQVADWIHQHQNLNVPEEWAKFVDQEQTFSWNLERCYQKAKDLKSKREGTIERLHLLQAEVEALKAGELPIKPGPEFKGKIKEKNSGRQVKARKLQLGDQFVAYVGKSAKDNLQLLRQARAWDLWLHLRDYPGSHCIIQRNKGETVPESLLREASQWVARATFGRKAEQKQGEKLTVLFAECRHVRPIKGDKMGRVTFRNETTLTIEFAP